VAVYSDFPVGREIKFEDKCRNWRTKWPGRHLQDFRHGWHGVTQNLSRRWRNLQRRDIHCLSMIMDLPEKKQLHHATEMDEAVA
jgi:hypothetical protein